MSEDSMEAKLRARLGGTTIPSGTTEEAAADDKSTQSDAPGSASENGTRKQTTAAAKRAAKDGRTPRSTNQGAAKRRQEDEAPADSPTDGGEVLNPTFDTRVDVVDQDASAVYTTVRRKRGIEEPTKALYAQVPVSVKVGLELLAAQEDSTMRDELIEALRTHFAAKGYSPPDWRDLTFGPGWRQMIE